jgi:hypothetical protein
MAALPHLTRLTDGMDRTRLPLLESAFAADCSNTEEVLMCDTQSLYELVQKEVVPSQKNASCGTAARAVYKFLCEHYFTSQFVSDKGVEALADDLNLTTNAIYLVCVNTSSTDFVLREDSDVTGDGYKWEHYFVIQKMGTEFTIYQAFVSCYDLGEWMSGVFPKEDVHPNSKYCPIVGENVPMTNFHDWFESFIAFAKAASEKDSLNARKYARAIFGGPANDGQLTVGLFNGIKIKWTRRTSALEKSGQKDKNKRCIIC